jgi:hypothetical protein
LLADYFLAAWKCRRRDKLGRASAHRDRFATEAGLSATYLAVVWKALADGDAVGPLAVVRTVWRDSSKVPILLVGGLGGKLDTGRVLDYSARS